MELLKRFGNVGRFALDDERGPTVDALIAPSDLEGFTRAASEALASAAHGEVLERALSFTIHSVDAPLDLSFIGLYAALESVLTFFRSEGDYENLPPEEFGRLERELKAWLKQHPLLDNDSVRRGRIYEKLRELNRLPFSYVFRKFCERYGLDLSDLWPVLGSPEEWPLTEIRHRLVHGDPFKSRPPETLACARQHLLWTVERMLLCVLGWPISQSGASGERLRHVSEAYSNWRAERAKLA